MRSFFKYVLTAVVAISVASPLAAETKIGGFIQGWFIEALHMIGYIQDHFDWIILLLCMR